MSLLNIVLADDRARVYVDTAAGARTQSGGARVIDQAKVLPLAVPNCVLAGRGNPAFLALLATAVHIAGLGDFDEIVVNLPALACTVRSQYAAAVTQVAPGAVVAEQELALLGWSAARQRMACVMCFLEAGAVGAECIALPAGGQWIGPWEWGREPAVPMHDAEAFALASEQIRRGREAWPDVNLGGRLMAATLTRYELNVRDLGSL